VVLALSHICISIVFSLIHFEWLNGTKRAKRHILLAYHQCSTYTLYAKGFFVFVSAGYVGCIIGIIGHRVDCITRDGERVSIWKDWTSDKCVLGE